MSYHFSTTSSPFQPNDCSYIYSLQGTITVTDCSTSEITHLKVTPLIHKNLDSLSELFEERAWNSTWSELLKNCANLHSLGFPWSCYIVRYEKGQEEHPAVLELAFLQSDPQSPGNLVFETKVFAEATKTRALFALATWNWIKRELLYKMIKKKVNIPIFDNQWQITAVTAPESATVRISFSSGEDLLERMMQKEGFFSFDLTYPRNYSIEVTRTQGLKTIKEEEEPSSWPKQKKPCCTIL